MTKKTMFGKASPKDIEDHAKWQYNTFFLDSVIPALDYMIHHGHGHPSLMTSKKWDRILIQMKEGFEILKKYEDGGWSFPKKFNKKERTKVDRSFDLFKDYFFDLWD